MNPRHDFRVVSFNVEGARWGGGRAAWLRRLPHVVARIRRCLDDSTPANPSIILATECGVMEAADLRKALGAGWKSTTFLYSTILYKGWTIGKRWVKTWNKGTHGAVIAELKRDGLTVNAVCSHLPPFVWRAKMRKRCIAQLASFLKGWKDPIVIGGDFNWRSSLESYAAMLGFKSARLTAMTKVNAGYRTNLGWGMGSAIDYILTRGLTVRGYVVMRRWNPVTHSTASDHHMVTVQASIPVTVNAA